MSFNYKPVVTIIIAFIFLNNINSQELLGLASYGGDNDYGMILSYNVQTASYSKIYDFEGGSTGGATPRGTLIQASNGRIYGMTNYGGELGVGTLFEYSIPTNTYTHYDFAYTGGEYPQHNGLVEASNGKLYGLTKLGSINDAGILFEFDLITKKITLKVSLGGIPALGGYVEGGLIEASNGKLYGMSRLGGANGHGSIFEYDINTNTINVIHSFSELNGRGPVGSLIEGSNGKLYGLTDIGGVNSDGTIFEYDLGTSAFTKLHDFDDTDGANPEHDLMEASNGKLYGVTIAGGANGTGVLFEFDISTSSYVKKVDFSSTNGNHPKCALIEADNGKLYGKTTSGGTSNFGVVFEFNPTNSQYNVVKSVNGTSEGKWLYGSLTKINQSILSNKAVGNETIKIYPNPTNGELNINGDLNSLKRIEIYGLNGQKVLSKINGFNKIDLSQFEPSIYLIKFNFVEFSTTQKFIRY